eukprot:435231-Amphidinium_carterae.3
MWQDVHIWAAATVKGPRLFARELWFKACRLSGYAPPLSCVVGAVLESGLQLENGAPLLQSRAPRNLQQKSSAFRAQ